MTIINKQFLVNVKWIMQSNKQFTCHDGQILDLNRLIQVFDYSDNCQKIH